MVLQDTIDPPAGRKNGTVYGGAAGGSGLASQGQASARRTVAEGAPGRRGADITRQWSLAQANAGHLRAIGTGQMQRDLAFHALGTKHCQKRDLPTAQCGSQGFRRIQAQGFPNAQRPGQGQPPALAPLPRCK
jgi:hypothetical protein